MLLEHPKLTCYWPSHQIWPLKQRRITEPLVTEWHKDNVLNTGWRTLHMVGLSCILRHYIYLSRQLFQFKQSTVNPNVQLPKSCIDLKSSSESNHKATISFWNLFRKNKQAKLVRCANPFFLLVLLFRKIKNALSLRALQGIQNMQKGEKIRLRYPVLEVERYIVLIHTKLRGLSIYHFHVSIMVVSVALYQCHVLWLYSTAMLAVCIWSVKKH